MKNKIVNEMKEVSKFKLIITDEELKLFLPFIRNPDALTNEMVQLIGRKYLALHPKSKANFLSPFLSPFGFFEPHANQVLAKELCRFNYSIAQERWNALVKIYAKMPNTTEDLPMTLLYCFGWAFHKVYRRVGVNEVYSNSKVAMEIKSSIDDYYSNQHLAHVKNNEENLKNKLSFN